MIHFFNKNKITITNGGYGIYNTNTPTAGSQCNNNMLMVGGSSICYPLYLSGGNWNVYNNSTMVPWPYGGFNLEAMDAHGGWVSSAEDLCKLLVAIDKFSTKPDILLPATIDTMVKPSAQDPYYSCGFGVNAFNNWWHAGSLPGTSTEFVRAGNQQLNWAIMTNYRPANANNLLTDIDNLVWNNLASVASWPTNDLFTGISDHSTSSIVMYPMPADDFIHVKISENLSVSGNVYIYNGVGELVSVASLTNDKISVADLHEGMYIIKVVTEKEISKSSSFCHKLQVFLMSARYSYFSGLLGTMTCFFIVNLRIEFLLVYGDVLTIKTWLFESFNPTVFFWMELSLLLYFAAESIGMVYLFSKNRDANSSVGMQISGFIGMLLAISCTVLLLTAEAIRSPSYGPYGSRFKGGVGNIEPFTGMIALYFLRLPLGPRM